MGKSSLVLLILMIGVGAVPERTTMPQSAKSTSAPATSTEADPVTMQPINLLKIIRDINSRMKKKVEDLFNDLPDANEEDKSLRLDVVHLNSPLFNNEFYLEALLGECKEDVKATERQKARIPKRMERGMVRFVDRVKALKENNSDNKGVVETMDFLLANGQIPEFLKIMKRVFG